METLSPSSVVSKAGWWKQSMSKAWTKDENKRFESALAMFDETTPYRWFKVAEMIPGKSVHDVINQYRELVSDVSDIEAGLVPIPGYLASSFTLDLDVYRKRPRTTSTCTDQERKKGVPWTEEEHRRFLLGLEKHGKGDWRNISRKFVISKTPTQVASHAQKYYLRQLSGGKDKRRPSIHDITTVHVSDSDPSPSHLEKSDEDHDHDHDHDHRLMPTATINTTASKIVMDWSHRYRNDAALMVVDTSFLDISKNRNGNGHCSIFNINAAASHPIPAPGFYIKPPRFYG